MSVYVRDGYTFQLFLRTVRTISEILLLHVYVRNNVLDKYENNLLHVDTKP